MAQQDKLKSYEVEKYMELNHNLIDISDVDMDKEMKRLMDLLI
jgi:hypothetical protein